MLDLVVYFRRHGTRYRINMDEKDIREHLTSIEQRLDGIEGKLSVKWFLPVFITVLAAALGVGNFFIQRSANSRDVNKNKENEIIGAFLGDTKITFYRSCKDSLLKIDEQFESYCQLGQEQQTLDELTTSLGHFKRFTEKQTIIDQKILEAIHSYSDFVVQNTFLISTNSLDKEKLSAIYKESKALYREASTKLSGGIKSLRVE